MSSFDQTLFDSHLTISRERFPGATYYDVLRWVHAFVKPTLYIEIGVQGGRSMQLAPSTSRRLGIDPAPTVPTGLGAEIYPLTSDAFFSHTPPFISGFSLAFIDGLHTFDQALRDFMHLESLSCNTSVIMLHDCIPLDEVSSTSPRTTRFYTGDVWKTLLILNDCRPDLHTCIIPAWPSGLALVDNLDSTSQVLSRNYPALIQSYAPLSYSDYKTKQCSLPRCIAATQGAVEDFLALRRAQTA